MVSASLLELSVQFCHASHIHQPHHQTSDELADKYVDLYEYADGQIESR